MKQIVGKTEIGEYFANLANSRVLRVRQNWLLDMTRGTILAGSQFERTFFYGATYVWYRNSSRIALNIICYRFRSFIYRTSAFVFLSCVTRNSDCRVTTASRFLSRVLLLAASSDLFFFMPFLDAFFVRLVPDHPAYIAVLERLSKSQQRCRDVRVIASK